MSQCVYLCPVNVAEHHHHALCDKHEEQDCGKLESECRWNLQNFAGEAVILNTLSVHTHRCETAGAFAYRCATANQADDKEQRSHCDDHHSRDEGVYIFKEVVIVVIRDEHVSANVA